MIRRYQDTCAEVIQRFDGTIAQYLGDGLLVYFGYPHAHDDDAARAVRAGLDMVSALQTTELQVRIGIHTGPVVISEIGRAERRELRSWSRIVGAGSLDWNAKFIAIHKESNHGVVHEDGLGETNSFARQALESRP